MQHNKEIGQKTIARLTSPEMAALPDNSSFESIDDFFDHLFVTFLAPDPQGLTQLRLFEQAGINEHNKYLNNVSPQALLNNLDDKKNCLAILEQYSTDALSHDQHCSYTIFRWMLQHATDGEKFLFHEHRFNHISGVVFDLTILLTEYHQLKTREDIEHYLIRLSKIAEQFEQTIAFLEYQKNKGVILPRFALERIISTIDQLLPELPEQHLFYAYLAKHIELIEVSDKNEILRKAKTVLETSVFPAYRNLHSYCTKLFHLVESNDGAWALPDGDDYYEYMLQKHTTTNLSANEIHELGLQEVAKIQNEMRTILAQEGIINPDKEVGHMMQELSQESRFYFPQTEEGKKECLKHYEAILERCRKELYQFFDIKPQAQVKIQQVPAHDQDNFPAAYYTMPSFDDSRPGIFFANLRDMSEITKFGMETLTVHEAEPGHHFQLALQQEIDKPLMRKLSDYTAYIEGWALYAEKLAYEKGFYSDAFSKLGHLQSELLRAVRLVLDTGIHKKRWSREQAIEYMMKVTGYHRNSVVTEIERYFVWPGQACSYKMGQLKILELRKQTQDALGADFDIKEFHNIVLKLGAAPLTILEEQVQLYIKQALKKNSAIEVPA